MNRTKRLLADPIGVVAMLGLLFLGSLVLAGCAEPAAIAAVPPTATVYAPPPTEAPPPPPEPTPQARNFPLAAPSKEPVEKVSDQTCVSCHTNQETLQSVAKEAKVVEELSEGEG
ncbi:MAG: hypothetical protein JXA93_04575 [Anaerolineae bacterium]|nr:hypothetical protein [Anaerolineae bacterium]